MRHALVRHQHVVDEIGEALEIAQHGFQHVVGVARQRIGLLDLVDAADFARYFAGLTAAQMGDNTTAERELKDVSSVHNKDLASLAKFALAAVYRSTNRDKEAIDLYKQIIDKPTASVSKATAQMELADFYQDKQQTAEAKRILEQVQKENPNSEIASLASQKLGTLK